ncbi:hypothetical protein OIU77_025836 [Salix suchowensis]|uniref:BTB domain-containing protein n=1 Tax=Salix suchowensis TaxID=1278906 RepID=A0ABQ9C0Y5_9ROSI|nr:hypothetical protein OIU77_025836 [Salix suchowensis]
MENANEMTASSSFASSSYLSNESGIHHVAASNVPEPAMQILWSRAPLVGVHRCVLAARSPFFHELFKKGNNNSTNGEKPRYLMSDLVPHGGVGYEAFQVFLHYLYTGKLEPSPPEVSRCVDDVCAHDACRPAINYVVELMCASATFQMKELVLLFQRRLLNFY